MRKASWALGLTAVALSAFGCSARGLSVREGSHAFTALITRTVDESAGQPAARPVVRPFRVAVAQIGENAPPTSTLDALRDEPTVFSQVSAVPMASDSTYPYPRDDDSSYRDQLHRTLGVAKDLDAQYLLLIGGYVDTEFIDMDWWIVNLLIVPCWFAPTVEIRAEGRVAAALIELPTGRVRRTFAADEKGDQHAPTFYTKDREKALVRQLRDKMIAGVTARIIQDLKSLPGDADKPRP